MTNGLKGKLEKKEAELKALRQEVKAAEAAELKAREDTAKLEGIGPTIAEAIQKVLDKVKLTLPAGKQIITTVGEAGLLTSILNGKAVKASAGKGNSGAKAISFDGKPTSWAGLAELKGVSRVASGSAHRDCYNKSRQLHDSIEHECSIDGKKYPVS